MTTRWILCLDGGGVRGLYTSLVLEEIERIIGQPIHEKFDMIMGTSVGGMISLCLAQGNNKVSNLFSDDNLNKIFHKTWWDKIAPIRTEPIYDGQGKTEVIEQNLSIKKFGDMATNVAVIAYSLNQSKTRVFRSWNDEDKDLNTVDLANATSSAPTYFPATVINDEIYIDGGISANSPALIALREGYRLWGHEADIRILSIGTGYKRRHDYGPEVKNWGMTEWLLKGNLISLIMDGPVDVMWTTCRDMLPPGHFLRLNGPISKECLDDTSSNFLRSLRECAHETLVNEERSIKEFFVKPPLQTTDGLISQRMIARRLIKDVYQG